MSMFYELMMRKKEQIMYATIKGTLAENDGVFSGFSDSNYLALQQSFTLTPTTKAEFVFRVSNTIFDGSSSFLGMIGSYSINFRFNTAKKLALYLGNGSSWVVNGLEGTTVFQENNFYYAKLVFDNGVITIYSSTDGKIWTQEATTTVSFTYTYNLLIGRANNDVSYQKGSIDLNQSYIKLGSTKYNLQAVVGYTIVGSPTIVDGVVSGFSTSDYLTLPNMNISSISEIYMQTSILNYEGSTSLNVIFRSGNANLSLRTLSGLVNLLVSSKETKTSSILSMTNIYIRFQITNNSQKIWISPDGVTWNIGAETSDYIENLRKLFSGLSTLGSNPNNDSQKLRASLNINETYIKINNKLWFNGQQA